MAKSLQKLIDEAAVAVSAAKKATDALDDYCQERYGAIPADLDADSILDAIYGLCGNPQGMSAKEFDRIMKNGGMG